MKIIITSASELDTKLELDDDYVNVIDKLRKGEINITNLIDNRYSNLFKDGVIKNPNNFVIAFYEDYVDITIYDFYLE